MAAKEKFVDDICVLMVKGKLMGGAETDECHNKVKAIVDKGVKKFVIDLSSVAWVNSRGLGMLMACFTSLKNAKGDMKLAGVTKKVRVESGVMIQVPNFVKEGDTIRIDTRDGTYVTRA